MSSKNRSSGQFLRPDIDIWPILAGMTAPTYASSIGNLSIQANFQSKGDHPLTSIHHTTHLIRKYKGMGGFHLPAALSNLKEKPPNSNFHHIMIVLKSKSSSG